MKLYIGEAKPDKSVGYYIALTSDDDKILFDTTIFDSSALKAFIATIYQSGDLTIDIEKLEDHV